MPYVNKPRPYKKEYKQLIARGSCLLGKNAGLRVMPMTKLVSTGRERTLTIRSPSPSVEETVRETSG